MKKIIYLGLFAGLLSFNTAQAQDFEFIFDNPFTDTTVGNEVFNPAVDADHPYIELDQAITNVSNQEINVTWTFLDVDSSFTESYAESHPNEWFMAGICDNIICRADFSSFFYGQPQNAAPIAPHGSSIFQAHIYAPVTSQNQTRVYRAKLETANQTDTAIFILTKNATTGISAISVTDKRVMLYPNPLPQGKNLNLFIDKNLGAENVAVFNILGQRMIAETLTGNSEVHTVNTSNLNSGIYIVRLLDKTGKVVATRKFTQQ